MSAEARTFQPAEWEAHAACWLAWPSHPELWGAALPAVRAAFVEMCRAVADPDPLAGKARGEGLEILVLDAEGEKEAREALGGVPARFHHAAFGDIWLRDTGPIFVRGEAGPRGVRFAFNGWGGKYRLPGDETVGDRIAAFAGIPVDRYDLVAEGGALEVDGEGTVLTTRQCLLNGNRNPGVTEAEVEAVLARALGAERVLWLDEGLLNDHTDGHVDTLVRFVAPGRVVCMAPEAGDPNREVLEAIRRDLRSFVDAAGRSLEILEIPSPGRVVDEDGALMPASYVNFYLGDRAVVVPTYGSAADGRAVDLIASCFPDREAVAVDARAVLGGGGAFHCISQQQPRP